MMDATTTSMVTTADIAISTDIPYVDMETTTIVAASSSPHRLIEHSQHKQITFEVPSHRDLEHINSLPSYHHQTLLQRLTQSTYHDHHQEHQQHQQLSLSNDHQIAKSVVVNFANLKNHHPNSDNFMDRFFGIDGIDAASMINYLWIGVVAALIVLSMIFIIFSCYFYRKFRVWKKCDKDIRSQMHANELLYPAESHRRLLPNDDDMVFYQLHRPLSASSSSSSPPPPPCYTIATGLPTYDEALGQQQQQQQQQLCGYNYSHGHAKANLQCSSALEPVHRHHHHHHPHPYSHQQYTRYLAMGGAACLLPVGWTPPNRSHKSSSGPMHCKSREEEQAMKLQYATVLMELLKPKHLPSTECGGPSPEAITIDGNDDNNDDDDGHRHRHHGYLSPGDVSVSIAIE